MGNWKEKKEKRGKKQKQNGKKKKKHFGKITNRMSPAMPTEALRPCLVTRHSLIP
jgi:hypothetical protein